MNRRTLAFAALVVSVVLALDAPAGAAEPGLVIGIADAGEPRVAAIGSLVLGAATIIGAIVMLAVRPWWKARA